MILLLHWRRKIYPGEFRMNLHPRLLLWAFIFFITCVPAIGQVSIGEDIIVDYSKPKEYEIGGVTVTGVEYLDKNVLIMLTGLNVGEKVEIPGEMITKAIKKLWKWYDYSERKGVASF